MQLENPVRQRRLTDIIDRENVVRRLANLDRLIARRNKQDADLADAMIRNIVRV
jgi:hypothetical protein